MLNIKWNRGDGEIEVLNEHSILCEMVGTGQYEHEIWKEKASLSWMNGTNISGDV